jgi:hypothetical protein
MIGMTPAAEHTKMLLLVQPPRTFAWSSQQNLLSKEKPRTSHALFAAVLKLSLMTVGWMPRSSSSWHFFSSAPQMTTTLVVPSPATTSCEQTKEQRTESPVVHVILSNDWRRELFQL